MRTTTQFSSRTFIDVERFKFVVRKEDASRGITPCIAPTVNRKVQHAYDKLLYRQRHKIEYLFARLKDWRRIATRYDRCPTVVFSVLALAATVLFWL